MKSKQSMIKMQLYQLVQNNLNSLLDRTNFAGPTSQKTNVSKINNQPITSTPFNSTSIIQHYLQRKIENIQKKKQNPSEIPLNPDQNSLGLGTDKYDSLFTFHVDTPQVNYDSNIWNTLYEALPSNYTIPDPKFINILSKA